MRLKLGRRKISYYKEASRGGREGVMEIIGEIKDEAMPN